MITTINEFKKSLKSVNENTPPDLSGIDIQLFPGQKDPNNPLENEDNLNVGREYEKQEKERERQNKIEKEEEEKNS